MNNEIDEQWAQEIRQEADALDANEEHVHNRSLHN